jgi:hypothetical protein
MNLPQHLSEGSGRTRWTSIAAGVWLAMVSGIAIVDSVGLSRLTEQSRANVQPAEVQAVAARVSDLEHQAEAAKRQPKPVVQADFDAARRALEERLARVEQAQASAPTGGDLQSLQARVASLEARPRKAPVAAVLPRKSPDVHPIAAPMAPGVPFSVMGLELRGGERFVSVALPGKLALADFRLLREGEWVDTWQLQAIDGQSATFRAEGQTVRLALP